MHLALHDIIVNVLNCTTAWLAVVCVAVTSVLSRAQHTAGVLHKYLLNKQLNENALLRILKFRTGALCQRRAQSGSGSKMHNQRRAWESVEVSKG